MNISYRKSIKEDIPYINNLFIEMVKTVNKRMEDNNITPYKELENGFIDNYLDKFYIDNNNVIFVALDNNDIIGFISLCKNEDNIYIDDYSVKEEYRGKGIGSKLMSLANTYALENNINELITHVETANKKSIEFYKNKGFKLVQKQDHRLLIKNNI